MKKIFLFALIALMGLMPALAQNQAAKQEVTIDQVKAITQEAKTQGANWNDKQWTEAFKTIMAAFKPLYEVLDEMTSRIEANPDDAIVLAGELAEYEDDFRDLVLCMEDLEHAAEGSPVGQKILDDDAYMQDIMRQAGLDQKTIDKILEEDDEPAEPLDEAEDETVGTEVLPLLEILYEARSQGSSWSEEKWQETFLHVYTKLQPMMKLINDLKNQADNESESMDLFVTMQKLSNEYGDADALLDDLEEVARGTINGAKVVDNEDLLLQLMKKAGWDLDAMIND